jgi:hypothetical protein
VANPPIRHPVQGILYHLPEPWTLDAAHLDPDRAVIRLMRHGSDGHYPDPVDLYRGAIRVAWFRQPSATS